MAIILSEAVHIEQFLYRELQKHWSPKLVNVRERIRLIPDLYKFRTEDPYIWAQSKGRTPQHYALYFDSEFVCDFDSSYLPQAVLLVFWRGLTKLYNERKIYFDKALYKSEDQIIKDEIKVKKHKRKEQIRKMNIPEEAKEVITQLDKGAKAWVKKKLS